MNGPVPVLLCAAVALVRRVDVDHVPRIVTGCGETVSATAATKLSRNDCMSRRFVVTISIPFDREQSTGSGSSASSPMRSAALGR
jgi:hypothetical protein